MLPVRSEIGPYRHSITECFPSVERKAFQAENLASALARKIFRLT
jgi:hypothetical protein